MGKRSVEDWQIRSDVWEGVEWNSMSERSEWKGLGFYAGEECSSTPCSRASYSHTVSCFQTFRCKQLPPTVSLYDSILFFLLFLTILSLYCRQLLPFFSLSDVCASIFCCLLLQFIEPRDQEFFLFLCTLFPSSLVIFSLWVIFQEFLTISNTVAAQLKVTHSPPDQ